MAIDTPAKRSSMLNMVCGLGFNLLPIPDGAYDAGDLQHLLGLYRGIAFAAADTLNIRLKLGSMVLVTTGAITPPSGATDTPWRMDGLFIVRSIGVAGSVLPTGEWNNGQTSGITSSALAQTLDTTVANDIEVTVEWGTASPFNSITVHNVWASYYSP